MDLKDMDCTKLAQDVLMVGSGEHTDDPSGFFKAGNSLTG